MVTKLSTSPCLLLRIDEINELVKIDVSCMALGTSRILIALAIGSCVPIGTDVMSSPSFALCHGLIVSSRFGVLGVVAALVAPTHISND